MAGVNPVQVRRFLDGVDYPAKKQDLMKHAQQAGADENVRALLQRLQDQTFNSPAKVSEAIGRLQ